MRTRSEAHPRALHYDANRDYVLGTLRRRCPWLDDGDREGMFHDAFLVLLDKEERGALDVGQMASHQIRAYLTQTALNKALDEGKRVGRQRSVPLAEDGAYADERSVAAEERVDDEADRARVREIIEELPVRQQAIVKLRFYLQRSPGEIQDFLDITERSYRRDLERAMRTIAKGFELLQAGEFCESRRSLILAFVAGIAGPNRMAAAQQHLATCRGCAAWAASLRTAGEQVAVAVPLPAVVGATAAVGDGPLAGALDRATGLVESVKHHAMGAVVRSDSAAAQYVASMRPGSVAAAVAGCLALTGGASYCAIEGLPFQTPLTQQATKKPPKRTEASRPVRRSAAPRDPAVAPVTSAAKKAPASATATASATAAARRAAEVKRVQRRQKRAAEFTFEGTGTKSGTKASAASSTSPPAAPPPPPASSGGSQQWGNEFSP